MIILGLDPSLRNTGYFLARVSPEGVTPLIPGGSVGIIATKPFPKTMKKGTYKNEYLTANATHVARELETLLTGLSLNGMAPDMICCETPVGSQTAAAAVGYGFCCGVLGYLQFRFPKLPLLHIRADEVKSAWGKSGGQGKGPTKAEVIEAATNYAPSAGWLTSAGRIINANEHPADALGAVLAGLKRPEVSLAVNMIAKQSKETQ